MLKRCAMLIFICLLTMSLTGCYVKSEGTRTGVVSKLSRKGIFFKTWEGEMVLGGIGASGGEANTWKFSVEDQNVVDEINTVQKNGGIVSIAYEEELAVAPWRGDTKYFAKDVLDKK